MLSKIALRRAKPGKGVLIPVSPLLQICEFWCIMHKNANVGICRYQKLYWSTASAVLWYLWVCGSKFIVILSKEMFWGHEWNLALPQFYEFVIWIYSFCHINVVNLLCFSSDINFCSRAYSVTIIFYQSQILISSTGAFSSSASLTQHRTEKSALISTIVSWCNSFLIYCDCFFKSSC